jgi:small subunit ribosomal protein S5
MAGREPRFDDRNKDKSQLEKVIQISRVTKVVKGGKNMSFRATVVVGDGKGKVGVGVGKSEEVPKAIRKAIEHAVKRQVTVPLSGTTIPHEIIGRLGSSKVFLKPAPPGTGVIGGGAVRAVLEMAGIRDVVAKIQGSSNIINSALATIDAFCRIVTEDKAKELRGVEVDMRTYAKVAAQKEGK